MTFDLLNLVRSSVRPVEYLLQVSSGLLKDEHGGQTARKHNAFADIVSWLRHKKITEWTLAFLLLFLRQPGVVVDQDTVRSCG